MSHLTLVIAFILAIPMGLSAACTDDPTQEQVLENDFLPEFGNGNVVIDVANEVAEALEQEYQPSSEDVEEMLCGYIRANRPDQFTKIIEKEIKKANTTFKAIHKKAKCAYVLGAPDTSLLRTAVLNNSEVIIHRIIDSQNLVDLEQPDADQLTIIQWLDIEIPSKDTPDELRRRYIVYRDVISREINKRNEKKKLAGQVAKTL